MERLDPRVRLVWLVAALVRGAIAAAILVGGATIVRSRELLGSTPQVIVPAAIALGAAYLVAHLAGALLRYRIWRFELRDDALYIERGVFTRVKTVVPFVRVQHVDSRRSPLERTVGLATVVVYTAGSRSADVAIPGLSPDRAERLQDRLRALAIESEGEDAV
ncbi:PH domain-containing protein [Natrialbaceae archaeon GCM10025810]|uniref:PH domain-containing protein n=1 Tax=Halovalidus salilacus TaxID=3075124 RepID=UPI00361ED5D9